MGAEECALTCEQSMPSISESTAWPMPFLEAVVNELAGSRCWFKLDAFKGFWMMPLADECPEMFSFMTDRGVYTPRRSIQGALNSATQFQSRMYEVFQSLIKESLTIWIDDLLGHADSYHGWFRILEKTLQLADERNIKFNLKKCELFTRRAKSAFGCSKISGELSAISGESILISMWVWLRSPE